MTDRISAEVRSKIMSRIRKKDTKPEMVVRQYLHRNGIRFRLYKKTLPGTPDLILAKYRTVIFINGCFWHSHKKCKYNRIPKSNEKYWIPKLKRTVERDIKNTNELKDLDWRVITVWECELEGIKKDRTLDLLLHKIPIS